MKFGLRTPSPIRSIKARTTGKVKRAIKKSINPFYGKKGMGFLKNPKKSLYNTVYSRTTFDVKDVSDALGGTSMASNKVYTTGPQRTTGGAPASGSPKPPVYKRPWFIVLMLLLIGFILICVLFGEISDPAEESSNSQIPSSSEAGLAESSEAEQPEPESEAEVPASEPQEPEPEASQPEASSESSIPSEEEPASSQSETPDSEPDTSTAAPIIIPPVASEAEPPASEAPASITYVLNTNTMKIHYPSCSSVDQIKPENYAETTDIEDALAAGYEPCGRCNPK